MALQSKNLKAWKSTVIGILLIGVAIAYLLMREDADKIIFFGSLAGGITMLFMPDTLINALGSFISKNKNKEI